MYNLEISKETVNNMENPKHAMMCRMLVEAGKKTYERMMNENANLLSIADAKIHVKIFQESRYYCQLEFHSNGQILRYEVRPDGSFENVFAQRFKGRNSIPMFQDESDLDKLLYFIWEEYPAPLNWVKYKEHPEYQMRLDAGDGIGGHK